MTAPNEQRVLVLAPTAGDAALTRSILAEAGQTCHVCIDLHEVCQEFARGAGAILLTEEAFVADDSDRLADLLRQQPPWSDVPVLLLCASGADSPVAVGVMESLGNVTILEQPVRVTTLVSTLRTALKARRRQYENRDQMEALRYQFNLTRSITDNATTAIFTTDAHNRCTFMNPAAEQMTGFAFEEANGRLLHDLIHHHHPDGRPYPTSECPIGRAVHTKGELRGHQDVFVRKNGDFFPVVCHACLIYREEEPVGTVIEVRDVTDEKRAADDLKRIAADLSAADRRKDEFLAMLAHELRNPLAPIRSGLDLLAMDAAGQKETIQLMQEQVEHVVRLVDDLLNVSRITQGKVELRKEPVELTALITRSATAVRPLLEGRQQEFIVRLPEQPIWLSADPVRLVQVFDNLLNNASKYTDAGGRVELTAAHEQDEVIIEIRDTGIGIEAELLPKVFELFTQSSRSLDRAQGGLGLGLTLVQRLLQMHDGTVTVESSGAGQGSTFTVRLPIINAAPPVSVAKQQTRDNRRRRVLVVDDNLGAAQMLSLLVTKLGGHEVQCAHDGPSALLKTKQTRPEIVFLDIGLPGMDGYQVGKAIRELPELDDVLLVALTGYGQQEDLNRSRQAGFDAHLVKPPSVKQIQEMLVHPKLTSVVAPPT